MLDTAGFLFPRAINLVIYIRDLSGRYKRAGPAATIPAGPVPLPVKKAAQPDRNR